jgi:hypothetical protein
LGVTGALPGGISASAYLPASGTLTLSGSASLANYQNALRQITYFNSNVANPSTATRTVRFQVTDGANNSNFQSRTVQVTGFIGSGSIPHLEEFTTNGEGVRYTSSAFNAGAVSYFEHSLVNPHPNHDGPFTFTAPQGGGFWASESISNAGNPLTNHGIVRLLDLNSTGFSNLKVHLYLGQVASKFDLNDRIEIQYAFAGDGGGSNLTAGTYTTIGRFIGDTADVFIDGPMKLDSDLDGTVNGDGDDAGSPTLTNTMSEFSFDIPVTGNTLSVQVRIQQNGGTEELAFDHIRVTGDFVIGSPPTLANIEGAALSFTEGEAAKQITTSLTVTDDGANITGATARLVTNNVGSQDVLADNGSVPVSITVGAYNSGTGTLPLSGTASVADYQTALRAITYQNTHPTNPSGATRTIRFQVTDTDSNTSNFQDRNINVIPVIGTGTLPHLENFDSDGDGVRYTSSSYAGGVVNFFERTDNNPHPNHDGPFTFSAPQQLGYWASEDVNDGAVLAGNPLDDHGIVRIQDLAATGVTDLKVHLYLAQVASKFDLFDKIEIQYAFDGNSGGTNLSGGSYTTIGRFIGDTADEFSDGPMRQDSNLNGAVNGDPADAVSPTLTATMTRYTFVIPATGNVLSVQVRVEQNGGSEELGFDHIEVTGTEQSPPVADLSNPANGGSLTSAALNAQGYIEATFADVGFNGLDPATITDAGAELALTGSGVGTAVLNGAASDEGSGVFRFTFTGSFVPGTVNVEFVAGSFADLGGIGNLVDNESFTVLNTPPTAGADDVDRHPTSSVKVPIATLLANDIDPESGDNTGLTITAVNNPGASPATVSISGNQVFYNPNGHLLADTFEYTVQDVLGATSTGTVTVNIITDPDPGSGGPNLVSMTPNGDGSVDVVFAGIPGRSYQIQTSETLLPGSWVTRATVIADPQGKLPYHDPPTPPPSRFYRTLQP